MDIQRLKIASLYSRPDGLYVIDPAAVKLPTGFVVRNSAIVNIPPGVIGGNHRHPRSECFFVIGEGLSLIWQDSDGEVHDEPVNPGGVTTLYCIPSLMPHAVINRSENKSVVLYELADGPQVDVDRMRLIPPSKNQL